MLRRRPQSCDEAREHSLDSKGMRDSIGTGRFVPVSKAMSDAKLEFKFRGRAESDRKESEQLLVPTSTTAFGDVGPNRDGRAAHLLGEREPLVERKHTGQMMDQHRQLLRVGEDTQVGCVLHRSGCRQLE
jgi:hypothetical protein